MIIGLAYGLATGNFGDLKIIFLAMATACAAIMLALVIGGYACAWSIVKRRKAGGA